MYSKFVRRPAIKNTISTSGLQRLADVHDPPESCDISIKAEFYGDCDGGDSGSGNG